MIRIVVATLLLAFCLQLLRHSHQTGSAWLWAGRWFSRDGQPEAFWLVFTLWVGCAVLVGASLCFLLAVALGISPDPRTPSLLTARVSDWPFWLLGFVLIWRLYKGFDRELLLRPKSPMAYVATESPPLDPVSPDSVGPRVDIDEWRQLEFFAANQIDELKALLAKQREIAISVAADEVEPLAPKVSRQLLLAGAEALQRLEATIGVKVGPTPTLTNHSGPVGTLRNGFSFAIARDITLYGMADASGIWSLAATLDSDIEELALTRVFHRLHIEAGLLFVDWRAWSMLVGAYENSDVEVWTA